MRAPLVAGNWKMNGDIASVDRLLDGILGSDLAAINRCQVLVLPPFTYLQRVADKIDGSNLRLAAQDVDSREFGAVTGGISAKMLKDIGCECVVVGHSERRSLFQETNEVVTDKFMLCVQNNLVPILCVGETLEQRTAGETLSVVTSQLRSVMDRAGLAGFSGARVAYEPVWAIGTGESATPEQAEEVHAGLRACLAELDGKLAEETSILYGGSVTAENAEALFAQDDVDGALVGGASLKATSFLQICRAAEAM
ncbi:MAG: triosephosphate isomerase [Candidatus Azotimanducaceae bacterium]